MGRKFRLSTHRKNEEIKKREKRAQQKSQVIKEPEHGESRTEDLDIPQPDCDIPQNSPVQSDFSVLKPISHPSDQDPLDVQNQVSRTESTDLIQSSTDDQPPSNAHLQSVLENIISMNPLPFPWIIVSAEPVIICRTKVDPYKQAQIDFTIRADTNMKWKLFVRDCEFDWKLCPLLCDLPTYLITMESILLIVQKLDSCNLCVGNQDEKFIELYKQRAVTLHGISNPNPSLLDALTFDAPTIRHKDCQWLVSGGSASVRCAVCVKYRAVLTVQSQRAQAVAEDTSISSHINYKYQPLPKC